MNLFAEPRGAPLCYQAVHKLVRRLRERTGISFNLHALRHSLATDLLRKGVPLEVVSKLLTHRSPATTLGTYAHLGVEDLRAALVAAGAWEQGDPQSHKQCSSMRQAKRVRAGTRSAFDSR